MNPHVPIGGVPGTKRECASGTDEPEEPDEPDYPSYDVMLDYDVRDAFQINDSVIIPMNRAARSGSNVTLFDDPSVCKDNNINRNDSIDFNVHHCGNGIVYIRALKVHGLEKYNVMT